MLMCQTEGMTYRHIFISVSYLWLQVANASSCIILRKVIPPPAKDKDGFIMGGYLESPESFK